ncbi:MAG: hypothetical protein EB127_02295 [Alphaproteobacteria bacterium]|nr:hypothetical protein [Alphaproteobacteria bacterium]
MASAAGGGGGKNHSEYEQRVIELVRQDAGAFISFRETRNELVKCIRPMVESPEALRAMKDHFQRLFLEGLGDTKRVTLEEYWHFKGKQITHLSTPEKNRIAKVRAEGEPISATLKRYFNSIGEDLFGKEAWEASDPKREKKLAKAALKQSSPVQKPVSASKVSNGRGGSISVDATKTPQKAAEKMVGFETPPTAGGGGATKITPPSDEKKPLSRKSSKQAKMDVVPPPLPQPAKQPAIMIVPGTTTGLLPIAQVMPELVAKKQNPEANNPNYSQHKWKVPFLAMLAGPGQGGKTYYAYQLIHQFQSGQKTFDYILIVAPSTDQPIFQKLVSDFGAQLYPSFADLPSLEQFKEMGGQTVVILDDILFRVTNKELKTIQDFFARGRHSGVSTIFITQSYFETNIFIRRQATHISIHAMDPAGRDLGKIANDIKGQTPAKTIQSMFEFCQSYEDETVTKGFAPLLISKLDNDEFKYRLGISMPLDAAKFHHGAPEHPPVLETKTICLPSGVTLEIKAILDFCESRDTLLEINMSLDEFVEKYYSYSSVAKVEDDFVDPLIAEIEGEEEPTQTIMASCKCGCGDRQPILVTTIRLLELDGRDETDWVCDECLFGETQDRA